MLYFSHYADGRYNSGCIIIDSDDDVATSVSMTELEAIINKGIEIAGVETRGRCPHKRVVSVCPYVYRDTKKAAEMLAKYDAEVVVNGGEIVTIYIQGRFNGPPHRIRLSEFATKCRWGTVSNIRSLSNPVTLVLDNKLSFCGEPFEGWLRRGVVLDIREVTRKATLKQIYDWAFKEVDEYDLYEVICNKLLWCIHDDDNRQSGYLALGFLCRDFSVAVLSRCVPNWPYACKFVQSCLKSNFDGMLSVEPSLNGAGKKLYNDYIRLYRDVSETSVDWFGEQGMELIRTLAACTWYRGSDLHRWYRVMHEFSPSVELCGMWTEFCKKCHKFLITSVSNA